MEGRKFTLSLALLNATNLVATIPCGEVSLLSSLWLTKHSTRWCLTRQSSKAQSHHSLKCRVYTTELFLRSSKTYSSLQKSPIITGSNLEMTGSQPQKSWPKQQVECTRECPRTSVKSALSSTSAGSTCGAALSASKRRRRNSSVSIN